MKTNKPPTNEEATEICLMLGFPSKQTIGWRKCYMSLRCNAPSRGSKCLLTFKQYVKLAKRAGLTKPSQIGKAINEYNLCRKKDIGDYEWENCSFKTKERNLVERTLNGGTSRQAEKHSKIMSARNKKNNSGRASQSQTISKNFVVTNPKGETYKGRNLKEFCLKHGLGPGNMSIVCRGIKEQHKGWTGKYTEAKNE